MFGVSTIETDQRFSGREDFWIIVAARSEDETEIRAQKAAGGRGDQGASSRKLWRVRVQRLRWRMTISFARHQFPPAIIRHAVWLYVRFTLSYRDVEDLLAERGLVSPTKRCGDGY